MAQKFASQPEFVRRFPQDRLRYSVKKAKPVPVSWESVEDLPLSEAFIDLERLKEELGSAAVQEIVDAVSAPYEQQDPLELFKRNLPRDDCPENDFAIGYIEAELRHAKAFAENSFPFALANTVQIWAMGNALAIVDIAPESGPELMAVATTDQDKKLAWSVGFGIELVLGILSILGVPKLNNTGVSKILRKILADRRLREAFNALTAGVTGAGLVAFITLLYEKGMLGDMVSEALTGASYSAILWALTLIASKFFSGGTLLAVHAGLLAVELGYKIATRP